MHLKIGKRPSRLVRRVVILAIAGLFMLSQSIITRPLHALLSVALEAARRIAPGWEQPLAFAQNKIAPSMARPISGMSTNAQTKTNRMIDTPCSRLIRNLRRPSIQNRYIAFT